MIKMNGSKYLRCNCHNRPSCDGSVCEISTDTGGRCYYLEAIKDGNVIIETGCSNGLTCAVRTLPGNKSFCCRTDFCNERQANGTAVSGFPIPGPAFPYYFGLVIVFAVFVLFMIAVAVHYCSKHFRKQRQIHSPCNGPEFVACTNGGDFPMAELKPNLRQRSMAMDIKLGEMIGKGSFGEVYAGTYSRDPLAVKIFENKYFHSFQKEANIYDKALRYMHENVLGYKGSDMFNGQLWLVTELCPLGSLHKYLDSQSVENVDVCIGMCRDIASGLACLHREIRMFNGVKPQLAHRDLKPSNIFLRKTDKGVQCVIGDFGYAVYDERALGLTADPVCPKTNTGQNECTDYQLTHHAEVGTPLYMAPEVLNVTIDLGNMEKLKCSDIYSMALVFWEIGFRTTVAGISMERHELPYYEVERESMFTDQFSKLDQMRTILAQGRRPHIPSFWQYSKEMVELTSIMGEAWANEPDKRSSALNIKAKLDAILNSVNDPGLSGDNETAVRPSDENHVDTTVSGVSREDNTGMTIPGPISEDSTNEAVPGFLADEDHSHSMT